MNGPPQLAVLTKGRPMRMKRTTIVTLIATITLLTLADSWMPTTRRAVTRATMIIAGTFSTAVTWGNAEKSTWFLPRSSSTAPRTDQPCRMWSLSAISLGISMSFVPGDWVNWAGMWMPQSCRTLVT